MDLGWKKDVAGVGSVEARVGFAQNKVEQVLEVYPSGYVSTGPDGQVFPVFGKPGGDGGVFLQNGLGSRRLTAEGVLTRDVSSASPADLRPHLGP